MQVERFLVKDKKEYTDFLIAAYKDQFNSQRFSETGSVNKFWQWEHIDNPAATKDLPNIWLVRIDGKIAGQFCLMPIALKVGDKIVKGGWCQNFIVLPQYRKMGIGRTLVSHVTKTYKDHLDALLVAGTNDTSYSIFKNTGITDAGYIPLYVKISRIDGIVNGKIKNKLLASLISMLGNAALGLFNFPAHLRRYFKTSSAGIAIKEVSSFDDSFDKLWESASAGLGLVVRRDSAYLNWRFVSQPYWGYKIFKAFRKNSPDTAGYIVLRKGESRGLRTGVISDIFASVNDHAAIKALVDFAVSYFKKKDGIDIIRCDLLNKHVGKMLRRSGFLRVPSNARLMFADIKNEGRDNWFFDYSDSDLDIFG
jgi:GNAT superfamily N-acetyltransferase